ncbi:MAG: HEAT repeat domain-containing protein [Verrucomicrobia bacterium]|nr:HEAT repeat domain-containing protein [Verrucomicrobiota bacterium]
MNTTENRTATLLAGAALGLAAATRAADAISVDDLIAKIKSTDDKVRGPAWQSAGPAGAPAVKPLAALMTDPNFEIARSAKRALYKIVRHAGRPGAKKEALAVEKELIPLLKSDAVPVRREVLWMLSEIGTDDAIAPMAALLTDAEVREDARCALMRFPSKKATDALKSAFAIAPEDFKFALAESLRKRGQKVDGYPSQKLVPTKQTTVGQAKTS